MLLESLQDPWRRITLCQMDADMILHMVAISERRMWVVCIHISWSEPCVLPSSHYPPHWLDACTVADPSQIRRTTEV